MAGELDTWVEGWVLKSTTGIKPDPHRQRPGRRGRLGWGTGEAGLRLGSLPGGGGCWTLEPSVEGRRREQGGREGVGVLRSVRWTATQAFRPHLDHILRGAGTERREAGPSGECRHAESCGGNSRAPDPELGSLCSADVQSGARACHPACCALGEGTPTNKDASRGRVGSAPSAPATRASCPGRILPPAPQARPPGLHRRRERLCSREPA